jgi:hypothetical protein
MSRILRRPMFRGGRVDSRGTGITTGLDRPGMKGGGMPPATTGGSLLQRATDFFTKPALGPDGQPIPVPRRNFAEDMMFFVGPGKFAKMGGYFPTGLNIFKEMGKRNLSSSKELVPFKETPFLSNQYFRNLIQPYTSGMKETLKGGKQKIKDYGIMGALGLGGAGVGYSMIDDYIEDYADEQFTGKEPPPPEDDPKKLDPKDLRILDLENQLNELLKKPAPAKDTDMEESVEIDKEKFAKVLGRDKARGQDIADMLLSFSSKALAPEADVKSAFAEFAADEVKRPSRVQKIDDSAAALAINKYIKGEISKQEAEAFLNRARVQSDLIKERGEKSIGQYYAASQAPTFAGRVKDAAIAFFPESPKFEVVESKDMVPVSEGGKFEFGVEDIGVIYIETDTKQSYTFDRGGNKITVING